MEETKITKENIGLFCIRTANDLMREAALLKPHKQLYGPLSYDEEITLLMADTNVGKSIFALQMANEIAAEQPVLYLDLEQSVKQFEKRYSDNFENHYTFNDGLYWVDFAQGYTCPEGEQYDDFFMRSLKTLIKKYKCSVVVIDNMTKLLHTDTDSAKNAIPLMDKLSKLKKEHNLALILIEHTRKMNSVRPISLDDLQGSKMKVNFADSVIAIGRSNLDLNLRYVKQLKCRSSEIEYDADNVMIYEVEKESNFLGFKFIGTDTEYNHVKGDGDKVREKKKARIIELREQGMSKRAIAKELGVSEGSVRKTLKALKAEQDEHTEQPEQPIEADQPTQP
ncbi:MAG: AAA family ATPase [Rikenellaceae bacterium]